MKILILGATGMLGHELVASLSRAHDVMATLRGTADAMPSHFAGLDVGIVPGFDALDDEVMGRVIMQVRPDAVVNAIGVVKQVIDAIDEHDVMAINAAFPHKVAAICRAVGARFLHISTDCVFLGDRGMYSESATPDATDLYGRSKIAGEATGARCLTLRTSMIGLELGSHAGLVEWFLRQQGDIRGYRRAVFSGLTTFELARVIERVLVGYPDKHGLYHVSAEPIDKFTLLSSLRERLGKAITIHPYDGFACDRSLDSTRFRTEFDYEPPDWDVMLDELCRKIRERQE